MSHLPPAGAARLLESSAWKGQGAGPGPARPSAANRTDRRETAAAAEGDRFARLAKAALLSADQPLYGWSRWSRRVGLDRVPGGRIKSSAASRLRESSAMDMLRLWLVRCRIL